jgi:predicted RNA polymerase sigma factor
VPTDSQSPSRRGSCARERAARRSSPTDRFRKRRNFSPATGSSTARAPTASYDIAAHASSAPGKGGIPQVVPAPDAEPIVEDDDTLTLLFMCCHPTLTSASSIALTLRAVGGLTAAEISNAFLVPEGTMAQRISRAEQGIKSSGVPFRMPDSRSRARAWAPSCTSSIWSSTRQPAALNLSNALPRVTH